MRFHRRSPISFFYSTLALTFWQGASRRLVGVLAKPVPAFIGTTITRAPFQQQNKHRSFSTRNDGDNEDSSRLDDTLSLAGSYASRSTNDPELSTKFYEGAEIRKTRLHSELQNIGLNLDELLFLPEFRGSAALRTYNSFIFPRSDGALAMANQPQRAAVVANSISFLLREHRSHQEDWLRNHDRSIHEAQEQFQGPRNPISLVLDDIRSAHNVGNIIRFAEAARCEKIYLCGSMTPAPPHPKVLKTALGAAEYVPYEMLGSTMQAIQQLKEQGTTVYAVETTSRSVPLWKVSFFNEQQKERPTEASLGGEGGSGQIPSQQIAFVFGNELVGVAIPVLNKCDAIISVPTHGIKNSLNVATCASVVTWEALRQWEIAQTKCGAN